MKKFLTAVLVFNLLVEWFAAFSLITMAFGDVPDDMRQTFNWMRNYGFGALAIGSTVIWVWPHRDNSAVMGAILGMLIVFHFGVSFSLAMAGDGPLFPVIHGLLGLACLFLFTQRSKWCVNGVT